MALMAFAPANARDARRVAKPAVNHTQYMGVPKRALIWYKKRENGKAPSLENAKVCREAAHSCNVPPEVRGQKVKQSNVTYIICAHHESETHQDCMSNDTRRERKKGEGRECSLRHDNE